MTTETTAPRRRAAPTPQPPQPLHVAQIPDALLKMKTVAVLTGQSTATLYRRAANDPTFPPLVKLGLRCTRIRAGDLTAWLAAQADKSRA